MSSDLEILIDYFSGCQQIMADTMGGSYICPIVFSILHLLTILCIGQLDQ